MTVEKREEIKKIRRKIEDTIRKEFSEDQIVGLAKLLKIPENEALLDTKDQKKKN